MPQYNKAFCPECGEKEITWCPVCQASIRGGPTNVGLVGFYNRPDYCEGCGAAFPWRARAIQSAKELAQLELTDPQDKETFMQNVEAVAQNTPQTKVAATKILRVLAKATGPGKDALRELVVDIASETAKKIILGH